eukprot:jgi/Mesvir1/19678/Mv09950-RA.1
MFCRVWRRVMRLLLLDAERGVNDLRYVLDCMEMRADMACLVEQVGLCWSPLHSAADAGDLAMTRALLAAPGVDVNLVGWHTGLRLRVTPVAVAAARGHLDVMRALLDAGAVTSAYEDDWFMQEWSEGGADGLFMEPDARFQRLTRILPVPAVLAATVGRQLACVTALVREYGASLSMGTQETAHVLGHLDPLAHAVKSRYPLDFVTALVEMGADPRACDALSLACLAARPGKAGDVAMVDYLLAWESRGGLQVETRARARRARKLRPSETFRLHPFSLSIDVIKKLLAAGWDINTEQYGYWPKVPGASTFLEHACSHLADHAASHSLALVRFLLDQGARAGLSQALLAVCRTARPGKGSTDKGQDKGGKDGEGQEGDGGVGLGGASCEAMPTGSVGGEKADGCISGGKGKAMLVEEAEAEGGIHDDGELSDTVAKVVEMLLSVAAPPAATPPAPLPRAAAPPAQAAPPVGRTIMTRSGAAGKASSDTAAGMASDSNKHVAATSAATGGVSSSQVAGSRRVALTMKMVDGREGKNALIHACGNGHMGAVRLLLAAGFDPNFAGGFQGPQWGGTPLLEAVTHGHADVVALLLASGACTDGLLYTHEYGRRRVDSVQSGREIELVSFADRSWFEPGYIHCKCKHPTSPLVAAASVCDAHCLRLLLEAGADPHTRDCCGHLAMDLLGLGEARKREQRAIRRSEGGAEDLHRDTHACLAVMLQHGTRTDIAGGTSISVDRWVLDSFLWRCVDDGNAEGIRSLIALGVDIFACHGGRRHGSYKGSVLSLAVYSPAGRRMLPLLLSAPGADPEWRGPSGRASPPLPSLARFFRQYEAYESALDAAKVLLCAGASPVGVDDQGRTPLHIILLPEMFSSDESEEEVTRAHEALATLLIVHSNDAESAPCERHGTPLEFARQVAEDPVAAYPTFRVMIGRDDREWARGQVVAAKRAATRVLHVLERAEEIREEVRRQARWARRWPYLRLRELAQRGRMEIRCSQGPGRSFNVTENDALACLRWMCEVAPQDIAVNVISCI